MSKLTEDFLGQAADPLRALLAEGDHLPFYRLVGDELTVMLDTAEGRQAARMLAAALFAASPREARALIARVGPEG